MPRNHSDAFDAWASQPTPIPAPSPYPASQSYPYSQPGPSRIPSSPASQRSASQPASQAPSQASQKPRCFECGTRRMRVRRGQLICKYGHVQQNFRIEHAFDDEFQEFQRVTGRRKMTREKKRRTHTSTRTGAVSEIEHRDDFEDMYNTQDDEQSDGGTLRRDGRRDRRSRPLASRFRAGAGTDSKMQGRFRRLQCLQLILRMQLEQINAHFDGKLPAEAELVARELWTLLVASLPVSEFPPEPLVAATYDYRHTHQLDEDEQYVDTDRGREPIYDIDQDLDLERRLGERDRRIRAEARKRKRQRNANDGDTTGQSETDAQTSGTEGWTDEDAVNRDLDDPEEMLASLDPVFAKEHRARQQQQQQQHLGGQQAQGEQTELRPDSDQEDDQEAVGSPAPRPKWQRSKTRPAGRRRLRPIHRRKEGGETSDGDSAWSEGYTSIAASSASRRSSGARRHHLSASRTSRGGKQSKLEKRFLMRFASLPSTLSILYLTLTKLQIPILWADLTDLAASYRLTFLEAVQRLPAELVASLNADDIRYGKLDVSSLPTLSALHVHTTRMAQLLHDNYGIVFDEPNGALMLWRLVDGMGLPPRIYVAAKRLLSFVGFEMQICTQATGAKVARDGANVDEQPPTGEGGQGRPTGSARMRESTTLDPQSTAAPYEFTMMAAILVIVKMRYGLDWEGRDEVVSFPPVVFVGGDGGGEDASDENATRQGHLSGLPRFHAWISTLGAIEEERSRHPSRVHDVYAAPPPDEMGEEEMEAFLAFAEDNLVLPNHPLLYSWRRGDRAEREDLLSFSRDVLDGDGRRDGMVSPAAATAAAAAVGEGTRPTVEEKRHFLLSTLYSTLPPPPPPSPPSPSSTSNGIKPGERYNVYHLTLDPGGVLPPTSHVSYFQMLSLANRVVGITSPPSYAPSGRWNPSRHWRRVAQSIIAEEREMGIQAWIERVEKALVVRLKRRREEVKRWEGGEFRRRSKRKEGGGMDGDEEADGDGQGDDAAGEDRAASRDAAATPAS